MELECAATTEAASIGANRGPIRDDQSLCAQWTLEPIPNLLGSQGRRYFVSDLTRELHGLKGGAIRDEDLLQAVSDNFFELYRFGVLQTSLKANSVYSEAYELRVLQIDLRYSSLDLCLLGVQADGSVDPVEAVATKTFLRSFLNEPQLDAGGQTLRIQHAPLYRELAVPDGAGGFHTLTSSFEQGLDQIFTTLLLTGDVEDGGLGIYDAIWPDAKVLDEAPYHESGKPGVKPLALFLTPSPGGPTGERWGTFPTNFMVTAALGSILGWGGGTLWISAGGNEQGGAMYRRDFLNIVPQYLLGPNRANGSQAPMGVMPDGTLQTEMLSALTARPLDIGAPHWCNEFDSEDETLRAACRSFVKNTTTLQAIETLQHGLGYMHAPEPRKRFHYDGETSSIARLYELLQDPDDVAGQLLHGIVNQYTTAGISTVWGQITSEWNGVGPAAGMQASLMRSHAREELAAAERWLEYAADRLDSAPNRAARRLLRSAVGVHGRAVRSYDRWEYRRAIRQAGRMLSLIDRALGELGEPDRIHDPLALSDRQKRFEARPHRVTLESLQSAADRWDAETYREGRDQIGGH